MCVELMECTVLDNFARNLSGCQKIDINEVGQLVKQPHFERQAGPPLSLAGEQAFVSVKVSVILHTVV